ncbi:hypothetical protein [Bradyrhizobium sp. NP1]|uniref:hypothetical protein n=1 Tax=Bradyrhizobium sp. NP1 TaxID=3049772 RepID=UPI0025A6734E|nr:hypothetical protein [Bradyrhizobium sp. NP1]WJR74918.1 hypothetical protein QOU61_19005 [Bradyrhizobium sp. NP1]
MTDDVAGIIRDLDAVVAAAGALADRLRAISARAADLETGAGAEMVRSPPTDLIPAAKAAELARRSKKTIARWCKSNPWDAPGGFAVFLRGRWHVSRSLFLKFLEVRS